MFFVFSFLESSEVAKVEALYQTKAGEPGTSWAELKPAQIIVRHWVLLEFVLL